MDVDVPDQTQQRTDEEFGQTEESRLPFGITTIGVTAGISGILLGIVAFVVFYTVAPTVAWILGTVGSAWYLRREESLTSVVGSALYIAGGLVGLSPVVMILPRVLESGRLGDLIAFLVFAFAALLVAGVLTVGGYLLHRR